MRVRVAPGTEIQFLRRETWVIPLLDAPMVSFGLAGKLSPHRARVVLTTHNRGANLTVSLDAANSNGIEFRGSWGSHRTTTVPPHDFGHGGAGRSKRRRQS